MEETKPPITEEKSDHTQALVFKNEARVDLEETTMVDDVDGDFNHKGFLEKLPHYRSSQALF